MYSCPRCRKRLAGFQGRAIWCWPCAASITLRLFLLGVVCLFGLQYACGADPLRPGELEYLGHFSVPARHESGRFGYGGDAMAYSAERDTLFAAGHVNQRTVSEMTVPEVGGQAELLQPFADTRGPLAARPEFTRNPRLDRVGGFAVLGDRLWISWYTYYAVQPFARIDFATVHSVTLDLVDTRGLYKVGPFGSADFGQKRTSKYMTTVPEAWAARYAPGYRLAVGKGDGAGSAANSQGPSLFVVRPEPGQAGVLPTIRLLHYPREVPVARWSPCDVWEGVVWCHGSVLFSGRRGRGEKCYGTPEQCRDECSGGKGYHCQPYGSDLLFYDEDALGATAGGRPDRVEPYAELDITSVLAEALPERCNFSTGAMAFDSKRNRIYLWQDGGERPIIHSWAVTRDLEDEPDEPDDPATSFRVTVSEGPGVLDAHHFDGEDRVEALSAAIRYLMGQLIDEARR